MSVIGDFTIPADSFALGDALSVEPEVTVEADRLATHSTMEVLPFLWATGDEAAAFQRAMADDSTVESATVSEETDAEVLYKLEWSESVMELIDDMVDHHAAIVEARGREDRWRLKLRFAEETMVSSFQEHFRERGIEFEVHQLSRPDHTRQREFGLTPEQHDALVTASREGYFRIPRDTSTEALGEMLGVSANAVSQRLRRGCDALIENALGVDPREEQDE